VLEFLENNAKGISIYTRIHVEAILRQNRLDGLTPRRVPEKKSESHRDSHRKDMNIGITLPHKVLNFESLCATFPPRCLWVFVAVRAATVQPVICRLHTLSIGTKIDDLG